MGGGGGGGHGDSLASVPALISAGAVPALTAVLAALPGDAAVVEAVSWALALLVLTDGGLGVGGLQQFRGGGGLEAAAAAAAALHPPGTHAGDRARALLEGLRCGRDLT